MKKFKKFAYLLLIIIIVILAFTIYTNASQNNEQDDKQKTLTEIKFVESEIENLLNTMNNIEARNYKVTYGEISKSSDSSSSQGEKSGTENQSNNSGGSSEESSNQGKSQDDSKEEKIVKFDLNRNTILSNSDEINWEDIKQNIETLYSTIPSITLDLYKANLNQEDILSFNKELDGLTVSAKEENKEDTLKQLSKLYDYLPKFVQNITDDELYKKEIETKSHIFKAYSKLDTNNWSEISKDVNNAISTYSQLLTNTNIDSKKQYSINRVYIMLNELQNAVSIKDTSVFLVKYKNLIEEISNL